MIIVTTFTKRSILDVAAALEPPLLEFINTFDTLSLFSGLKINNEKCEIAGIGVKKGVKMALCGMECIDLTEDT